MRDKLYRINNRRHYASIIDDAGFVIEEALRRVDNQSIAVAVSGGKDSVALCHLVSAFCRPLIIFNDSGLELPDSEPVVHVIAGKLGLQVLITHGDAIGMELSGLDSNQAIIRPIKQTIKDLDIGLEFVGLRREESRARRMLIGKHGPVHDNQKWGCLTAWPMRNWTAADSFAYIDQFDLPLHPAYSRTHFGQDRDSIRVSWAFDRDREHLGEVAYLRHYYPDLFRRLRDRGLFNVV